MTACLRHAQAQVKQNPNTERRGGYVCAHMYMNVCGCACIFVWESVEADWIKHLLTELSPPALVTYLHLPAEELLTTSICWGKVIVFKGVAPGRLIKFFTPHGWYSEQHTGQTLSHLGVIRAAFYLTDTTPEVGYSSGLKHKLSMQKALAKKYIQ